MLAITSLIPLLLLTAVSASPFTFSKGLVAATTRAAIGTPAPTATTETPDLATPPSSPEHEAPRRTQEPHQVVVELRDAGGFAISSSTAQATAAAGDETTTTPTTLALAAQAEAPATTDAPPTDDPSVDADLAREGYSQTTYYSCERYATTTMCGWHEPVLYVGSGAPGRGGGGGVAVGAAAAAVGGMVMNWAVLGW